MENEIRSCPMCNHDNAPMGIMGNLMHYSCRACGMAYSATLPKCLRLPA